MGILVGTRVTRKVSFQLLADRNALLNLVLGLILNLGSEGSGRYKTDGLNVLLEVEAVFYSISDRLDLTSVLNIFLRKFLFVDHLGLTKEECLALRIWSRAI